MKHSKGYYIAISRKLNQYIVSLNRIKDLLDKYNISLTYTKNGYDDFYSHLSECKKMYDEINDFIKSNEFKSMEFVLKDYESKEDEKVLNDYIALFDEYIDSINKSYNKIIKGCISNEQCHLIRDIVYNNVDFTNNLVKIFYGQKADAHKNTTYYFDFIKFFDPSDEFEEDNDFYPYVRFYVNSQKGLLTSDSKYNALIDLVNIPTEKVSLYVYKTPDTKNGEKQLDLLAKAIKKYNDKYGPFLKIENGEEFSIDIYTAYEIINRIKATLRLKQELSNWNANCSGDIYKIFCYSFYLLVSPKIDITIKNEASHSSRCYKTKSLKVFNEIIEYFKSCGIDVNVDNEFIYSQEHPNTGCAEYFCSYLNKVDLPDANSSSFEAFWVLQFMKNFVNEIGGISKITDEVHYMGNSYLSKFEKLSASYLLCYVASIILNDELNYHLNRISLKINEDSDYSVWNINDLVDALYLAVAQLNSDVYIVKKCKYCGNSFIDYKGNQKKVHCSERCSRKSRSYKHSTKNRTQKQKYKTQLKDILITTFDNMENDFGDEIQFAEFDIFSNPKLDDFISDLEVEK